jgi:hypothetical protein
MFCGAAGEALSPAEHPFNNLSALRAQIWTEPNLNTNILPEPLLKLVCTKQIKVRETDGIISIIPIKKDESVDYIAKLRGSCSDGKLTVDKFLAQKRADKELEA